MSKKLASSVAASIVVLAPVALLQPAANAESGEALSTGATSAVSADALSLSEILDLMNAKVSSIYMTAAETPGLAYRYTYLEKKNRKEWLAGWPIRTVNTLTYDPNTNSLEYTSVVLNKGEKKPVTEFHLLCPTVGKVCWRKTEDDRMWRKGTVRVERMSDFFSIDHYKSGEQTSDSTFTLVRSWGAGTGPTEYVTVGAATLTVESSVRAPGYDTTTHSTYEDSVVDATVVKAPPKKSRVDSGKMRFRVEFILPEASN